MTITISEVQEIIKNLESGGELSIKGEKYLKIAKLCVQLAAENVALVEALEKAQKMIDELEGRMALAAMDSEPDRNPVLALPKLS